MITEIEAKFLNVNHDQLRSKLKNIGATCKQPMRTMKRAIMDYPDRRLQTSQDGWIRVRDEGDKITLTYKESNDTTVDGAREIELIIDSYDLAIEMFKAIGLVVESEQETKRESWIVDGCQVELDEWPWLKPYFEIEGPDEEAIKKVAEKLGYKWSEAVFGSTTVAYKVEYPGITESETVGMIKPGMSFGKPIPQWLVDRSA